MSGSDRPPEPNVPTTRLKRKHFSSDDQEDLDDLDRIFKRIKTAVPRAPYILSTPSLDPYRYRSQQEAHAWMLGHLWHHTEEQLQYRTYYFREPYQDCFTLQHGEDEEPKPERPKSQTSNTTQAVAKKKISLSDYKSKQVNGVITPGSKKPSPPLSATKITPVQTNGASQAEKQSSQTQRPAEPKAQNRPPPEPRPSGKPSKQELGNRQSSAPAPPRQSSQKPESVSSKMDLDESGPSGSTPHGLPPLLSPVHQPLSNPYGLPDILSPTLPSNVQAELDRLEIQRKRTTSNASSSSSDRKSQILSVPDSHPKKPEDAQAKSRVRSMSTNEKSPNGVPPSDVAPEKKPSHVVKFAFSQAKAQVVKQILRLPPKRNTNVEKKQRTVITKQHSTKAPSKVVEGSSSKSKAIPKTVAHRNDSSVPVSKSGSTGTKVAEKRPRAEDDASASTVPSKRPRAHSSLDAPITPTQQPVSSPAPSAKSSAPKSQGQYATPSRKDAKNTVSMLRTNSSESYDATPGGSGTTPMGSKQDSRSAPTSSPLTGKKQADIALLAQISMKLNKLGRSLKHEAQKIVAEKGSKATKEDEKRAAITSLECILTYMVAYTAQDLSLNLRGRFGEVAVTWKTLLPLCMSYVRPVKNFRHLEGLRSYLAAVIAGLICNQLLARMPGPKAHDSPQDIARTELAKQQASVVENAILLADHYKHLHRHSQEARIALPMDEIQAVYKKTWAGRETNSKLSKEPEKVNGARLSGPYFLPIGPDTTPIQAVRFGLKFLQEYCEKEKIEYTSHIDLDKLE